METLGFEHMWFYSTTKLSLEGSRGTSPYQSTMLTKPLPGPGSRCEKGNVQDKVSALKCSLEGITQMVAPNLSGG